MGSLALVSVLLMMIGGSFDRKTAVKEENPQTVTVAAADEPLSVAVDLEQILSKIDGAGKVDVMISWDGDVEETYAYHEERSESQKEDGSAEKSEKRELVLTDGDQNPVVIARKYPKAEGVLVVAEGAGNDLVRERLLEAVASYLSIGKNRIEITVMEGQ